MCSFIWKRQQVYVASFCAKMKGIKISMLTPMNHREIEYNIKKFWNAEKISEQNIADIFAGWSNETEKRAALNLMSWLEETQKAVFQEDLLLDYGADCLRLYLMFEKTPKPDDTWLDTWEECNLEGCYKFLGRFRRMILVANDANSRGIYQKLDAENIQNRIYILQKEVMKHIGKGNTMPDRHNAISTIMEGMKEFQKELSIGELVTSMHSHEIAMAVPHAQKEGEEESKAYSICRNVVVDDVLANAILLLVPFAPVLCEHLWQQLKADKTSVFQQSWKREATIQKLIKLPIQVNAKTKKVMTIHVGASKQEVEEKAIQEISQLLQGKEYSLIYVPEKIINFVII